MIIQDLMTTNAQIAATPLPDYVGMMEVMLSGMSKGSRRQYEHSYNDWRKWCSEIGVHPDELSAPNVMHYLQSRNLSRATKQARLTHLRRLVQTLYSADTSNTLLETYHEQLKLLRLSRDDVQVEASTKGKKRHGKRLDGEQVHELITRYPVTLDGKPYLKGLRNRALLAVLFYGGLRRFEAVKLKWADIDFVQEHICVVGGKGRQRDYIDYVPFLGSVGRHLRAWQEYTGDRVYVFPRVRKGDRLGADYPMTDDGLYKLFKQDFAPHDARRTLVSSLLDNGSSIADVKAIARHLSENTTLRYAKANETKVIGKRVKLGY